MTTNTITRTFARCIALPIVSAGIIGGEPGWHGHHGVTHIERLVPGYHR